MKLDGTGALLRIFVGEADKSGGAPVYERIVRLARENGLAGATVSRGVAGFGAVRRVVHTAKIVRLSEDLPMVVEIVDTEEAVRSFLPLVDELFVKTGCGGLVTLEHVEIIQYTHGT